MSIHDQLLDNLKARVQEVGVLAADGAWGGDAARDGVPLTEDEIAVTQLCAAVEQCLLHGMRRRDCPRLSSKLHKTLVGKIEFIQPP